MDDHDAGLYGRSFADVYDRWYSDFEDPGVVVQAFSDRCPDCSTVIEFGAGTGRLAAPLAAAGFEVIALDVSAPMLDQAPRDMSRMASDMARTALRESSADAVLIAYNTLFNLATRSLQVACLAEAARVLRPNGLLAIENFIGPTDHDRPEIGLSVRPHHDRQDAFVAILTQCLTDGAGTSIVGTHVELLPEGTFTRPWRLRYLSPDNLDALASAVGLVLSQRLGDWDGSPFDPNGSGHVSWYRLCE